MVGFSFPPNLDKACGHEVSLNEKIPTWWKISFYRRAASRRIGLVLGGSVLVLLVWFHHGGQARRPTSAPPQPPPPSPPSGGGGDLPDDLLLRAAPPNEPRVVKTQDREANLMARMEKSMLKAAMKEEQERARLPKPEEILQEAVGPAGRVEPVQPLSTQPAMKLLVIAREGAGFPVLGQFLTRDVGVFEHGEPPMEVAVVGNLFNCILSPEMVATFQQQVISFCFVISYLDKASMQCNVENGVEIIGCLPGSYHTLNP